MVNEPRRRPIIPLSLCHRYNAVVPLNSGTRLGPYEILALRGAGGMGEVYRARDTRLDRVVAIKLLPEDLAADPDRARRFEQEARAVAALNHPNICQIYDVGPGYLVLEYVEGAPPAGPMSEAQALRLASQIAAALDAAHQQRILHRDLKPGNVLVTPNGNAKLLDFGLAKSFLPSNEDLTRAVSATIAGTASYMSPEQAQGRDLLRDEPASLPASPLSRVVRRCLEKDPSRRFQTMSEAAVALEALPTARTEATPSVAVLPFANMSRDKDNEYFSDGLSEEIINALAHIPEQKVTARTSAFAFRGKEQDIRAIAKPSTCARFSREASAARATAPGMSVTVTAGERSLPLCSYPTYPRYRTGDLTSASAYECAADEAR